ncbi:MAG: STAS domain-containing protein [Methylococcales bacterium]|nr:STAS domain-containing protein [Methylococcales bacterium]
MLCFGKPLAYVLERLSFSEAIAVGLSRCAPILAVFGTSTAVYWFDLNGLFNVAVVGDVPAGLPRLSLDFIGSPKWQMLLPFSAMIALIAYIESVAISKVVANITRQKIDPNQELIALGGANLMTALSGGMSVAGGFSRTMVNFSAGARTQLAMLVAVSIVTIAMLFFTAGFYFIPKATLAAIIIMAVLPLVRLNSIIKTWRYDNCEGASEVVTLLGVLLLGIEEGLAIGVIMTFVSHIRKVSHPHIAVVGRVPGTEHFRNERRHTVQTWDTLLLLRIDESMTYHNIIFIEEFVNGELTQHPDARSVVLIFASVSNIDATALEVLVNLNKELSLANIKLCLSEVKGPVMDRLERTEFLAQLTPERVFLTTEQAVKTLLD